MASELDKTGQSQDVDIDSGKETSDNGSPTTPNAIVKDWEDAEEARLRRRYGTQDNIVVVPERHG